MYEICRLLAAKKVAKPRKKRIAFIKAGTPIVVLGQNAVITRRDDRYTNAWFIAFDGVEYIHSFSRDMIKVV